MSNREAEQFNPHRKGKPNNVSERGDIGHRPYGVRSSAGGGKQMGSTIAPGFLVTGQGNTKATGGRFAKVPAMASNSKSKG